MFTRNLRGQAGGLWYPNAANTGATLGALTTVGAGYLTSGPGWSFGSGAVNITGSGVTFAGYNVLGGALVKYSGVTISGCQFSANVGVQTAASTLISNCVIATTGGSAGVQLQNGSTYSTVQDCTIYGTDPGTNRMVYCVQPLGADPQLLIQRNNFYNFKVAVPCPQQTSGAWVVQHNYMHDLGFLTGDHSEPLTCGDGTAPGLIYHNTLLNQLNQTACVAMGNTTATTSNITVAGNLIGGAGYCIYAAGQSGYPYGYGTSIVIQDNAFTTAFFPAGGYFGPVTFWSPTGNTWSGNVWYDGPNAGQAVPSS